MENSIHGFFNLILLMAPTVFFLGLSISNGEYLNTQQLSEYIKRSAAAVRNLVLRRKIPFKKVGGRLLFIRKEIDGWIQMSEGVSLDDLERDCERKNFEE